VAINQVFGRTKFDMRMNEGRLIFRFIEKEQELGWK